MEYAPPRKRVGGLVTAGLAGFVFTLHCVTQFILYRGRVVNGWSLAKSDAVVFVIPSLVAVGAYAYLFGRSTAAKDWPSGAKRGAAIALSLGASFLSY